MKNSNEQNVENKINKKIMFDKNKDNVSVIDTTVWTKEETSLPGVPSNFFAYEVTFTKKDSVIRYYIDSEKEDTCIPIFLDGIEINTKARHISIHFRNKKIKTIGYNYKTFLSSDISHIITYYNANSFLNDLMFEEQSQIDSFLRAEFGIKRRVKK